MPAHDSRAGATGSAPGPALTGPRDRLARLLPPSVSLPLRAHVGNSREPELAVLDRFIRPGSTVIDIGAHKGVYTHWLSREVGPGGRVLAYEPQPELHRYLLAGLATRWYRNVVLSDVALSDHPGTARLTIPVVSGEQQIAWASLEAGSGIDVEVRTSRLDDEVGDRAVSFVKCDVEGHESKVLDGAARLLSRRSAVWLVEVEHRHAGAAVADVLDAFSRAGYQPWYLSGSRGIRRVRDADRTPERLNGVEPGRYVNNFFFIPG